MNGPGTNDFYRRRADVFLDASRSAIVDFLISEGIPIVETCPTRFWLWVYAVRTLIPESDAEERAYATARLAEYRSRVQTNPPGLMVEGHGLIPFPSELKITLGDTGT